MSQAVTEEFTIAEAAERAGVSPHTLRYYERIGALLEPPERAASGHRRYSGRDLEWIRLLTCLRATGMPIASLLRYVELARRGTATATERKELLVAHRAEVIARVEELHQNLKKIDYKIDSYEEIERTRLH